MISNLETQLTYKMKFKFHFFTDYYILFFSFIYRKYNNTDIINQNITRTTKL